ncbi:MAG: pentapeptide repeat-containing protein [Cyanobacteria bacterium P01_A01_bin.17]
MIIVVFFMVILSEAEPSWPPFALFCNCLARIFDNSELFVVVSATVVYFKEKSNREIQRQNEFSNILRNSSDFSTKALVKILEQNKSEGILFTQRNFSGIQSLEGIDLSHADMSGSIFKGVGFMKANLRNSVFYRSNLHNANMEDTSLMEADLREANLHNTTLDRASLQRADLREANLYKATLRNADLNRANLNGADLTEANLYGADLSWVNLNRVHFKKTKMPDGAVWDRPERKYWNVWS